MGFILKYNIRSRIDMLERKKEKNYELQGKDTASKSKERKE